ncbi:MAG: hypothetical protein K0S27_1739 [Gammaproteobacteria bacterium]|jgi:hypothetical protein|nr:hypothetical protein [Gammaproteobacteria bacterium]
MLRNYYLKNDIKNVEKRIVRLETEAEKPDRNININLLNKIKDNFEKVEEAKEAKGFIEGGQIALNAMKKDNNKNFFLLAKGTGRFFDKRLTEYQEKLLKSIKDDITKLENEAGLNNCVEEVRLYFMKVVK